MKDRQKTDKSVEKRALPYVLLFNWAPPVAGIVTVILAVCCFFLTMERVPTYLIVLIGCYCAVLPRVIQNNMLLGMYRKGELALFRQIVRKCGASNRYGLFIAGECAAGEHQAMIDLCSKMLSQRKWNRRLRYLWLAGLADCYFELGDCEKLLLVCDAFDRVAAKEKDRRRTAALRDIYDRYRAYAQKDRERCREILAQPPKTDFPVDIYERAFYAARVFDHVLDNPEAARMQYQKAASWNEDYSFVRTAKLELEAMERGERYTDTVLEVLPDPAYVLRPQKEYMRTNLSVLVLYTLAMILICVTAVTLAPRIVERRYERELEQRIKQDYLSVQQLDRFNLHVDGELVETMFVCHMDDCLVIGSAYTQNGQLVYQNHRAIPVTALQNESKPIGPIEHESVSGVHLITTAVYLRSEDLPEQVYYAATVTIDGQTYYIAVTEITEIPS